MAKAPKDKAEKPVKGGRGMMGLVVALLAAIGAIVFLPTTIVVAVGMIPTAVAFFSDSSRDKSLGPTVMFLNFAGVLPSLVRLWHDGNMVSDALDILMQPVMMLIILLPAGFGWILHAYVPMIVSSVIRRNAEARIRTLEKEQDNLIKQWGAILTGPGQAQKAAEPETESSVG